jgi:tetratricopeptide (TPR) repeat protein
MTARWLVSAAALLTLSAAIAHAAVLDSVRTVANKSYTGKLKELTPLKVVIEHAGTSEEIPTNEILSLNFSGEPGGLATVRNHVIKKEYQDAVASLEKLEQLQLKADARPEIKEDLQYYRALCDAKLAESDEEVTSAGKQLVEFLKADPTTYHYYEACEILGDLLVRIRSYSAAANYYGKLADSPFPEYKMRAGTNIGQAMLLEKKFPEAQRAFEGVLAVITSGEQADLLRTIATLGKARCLAETGQADDALRVVDGMIDKTDVVGADPDQIRIMAMAYNAKGAALRKLGKNKEALLAYLHVDVLYDKAGDAHAEALANLAELWDALDQPGRATKARNTLFANYPHSPWASRGRK